MQFITSVFLPLLFLVHHSIAGPVDVESRATDIAKVVDIKPDQFVVPSIIDSNPSSSEHKAPKSEHAGVTDGVSPNTGFNTLASSADMYIICGGTSCDGECVGYYLSEIKANRCYSTKGYYSAYIRRASGAGLNYRIFASKPACSDGAGLPRVNTCYYVNGRKTGFFRN